MRNVKYLTADQLVTIHYKLILETGGSHGIRDVGGFESALLRPQGGMQGVEFYPSIESKAASLMHSIIQFHPFVDGNKRTAMVSAIAFLRLNGLDLKVAQRELEDYAVLVATANIDVPEITEWLAANVIPYER